MLLYVVLLLGVACGGVRAAENVLGSCPVVEPMAEFNMSRFAGVWYVSQTFDNRVKCLQWDISYESDDVWKLVETKQSGVYNVYNGRIFHDKDDPAALTVSWSANLGGSYPMTVYTTDYETFAGIFMCQKLVLFSRQNGMIMSRTPIMKPHLRQATAGLLSQYGVHMDYFHRVEQSNCGRRGYRTQGDEEEQEEEEQIGVLGEFGGKGYDEGISVIRIN